MSQEGVSDADAEVQRLVLRKARKDAQNYHLRTCAGLTVTHPDAKDGEYGCDTGCEYARLEANLTCPHGESEDFTYGEFGDIASMIREMSARD